MSFTHYIACFLSDTDQKDWSILGCLQYLEEHIRFTSDSKHEIFQAIKSRLDKASNSTTLLAGSRKKAKRLVMNLKETFQRKEIIDFFEEVDKKFETRRNDREVDKNVDTARVVIAKTATLRLVNHLGQGKHENVGANPFWIQPEREASATTVLRRRAVNYKEGKDEKEDEEVDKADEDDSENGLSESELKEDKEDEETATRGVESEEGINMRSDTSGQCNEGNLNSAPHTNNDKDNGGYVERFEIPPRSTCQRSWILSSGIDVGTVLTEYAKKIPDVQKCLNAAYWHILDLTDSSETKHLFSMDDWTEIVTSFEEDVKLVESGIPKCMILFFDELEKVVKTQAREHNLITAIEGISLEAIENTHGIEFTSEDRELIMTLRRAIVAYAENLRCVDVPVSEAAFDNMFMNMLIRKLMDPKELKMDIGEIACWASAQRRNIGRSIVLRARIGQKCDFRGTLKNSINCVEALIGLRSGGLPEANRKKIFMDRMDLAVALRDVIFQVFMSNPNAASTDLHKTYVIGMQSWGWTHEIYAMDCKATNVLRFGKLRQNALPNTTLTLPCLENFFVTMLDLKATLRVICDHVNGVALSHSRMYRKRRINSDKGTVAVAGNFGNIPATPLKKSRTEYTDD